ncbi:MAG TPA: hypothetical protein VGM02_17260 [Acidobacteriaceae bacterium]|jgi:hypothetical protein
MTSPQLTDQKPRVDAVEVLRVLVADLRALADRLDLKEHSPTLQQTLKAAQERVSGPRAVVMLLGEHGDLKRRFLERLLGPELTHLPNPTTVCTRLEYGAEPQCTLTMPQGLTAVLPLDQLENFLSRRTPQPVPPGGEKPRQTMQMIRLPNPALQGGLAVIDTPVVASGEPNASVLECAGQADAWIFVLNADHEVSEASQALLRQLPERGARLEMVVENAETQSAEERLAARERLMQTLREHCNIDAPRLTLVASAATEGDEGNFWHGRFATFHSVMMLRGRERWMEATRAVVLDALSEVGAEIDFELKRIGLGLRHARLRLGMKDLDGLRKRFYELGRLTGEPAIETKPVETNAPEAPEQQQTGHQSKLGGIWAGGSEPAAAAEGTGDSSPLTMLADAIAAAMGPSEDTPVKADVAATGAAGFDTAKTEADIPIPPPEMAASAFAAAEAMAAVSGTPTGVPEAALSEVPAPATATVPGDTAMPAAPPIPPAPMAAATFVSFRGPGAKVRPKRGLSVHFSEDVTRLMHSKAGEPGRITLLKRVAGIAVVIAFLCLIVWALSPRGFFFGHEAPAEWDDHQPKAAASTNPAAPAAANGAVASPVQPTGSLPDTSNAATPDISGSQPAKPSAAVRVPLARPIPGGATAGQASRRKRHHRHLLGLNKLWHWVRHPHGGDAASKTNNE